MAGITGLRESTRNVIRIDGALEILQVTRHASGAGQLVIVVDVTIRALARRNRVRAGQDEVDHRVIEGGWRPSRGGMALRTIGWEVGSHVIRVRGALKILQVTTYAGDAGQVVIIANVAIDALAGWNRMPARQREADRSVIKFCIQPVIGGVTGFAGGWKVGAHVIRLSSRLKVGEVA